MTLALIAVGAAGIFIGARFLAPAILVFTLIVVMVSILTGVFLGSSLKLIFLRTLYLILTLQGCYLIGLGLTVLTHRRTDNRSTDTGGRTDIDTASDSDPDRPGRPSARQAGLRKPGRTSSPRRPSG
ncbi:hypothetical protein [Aquamicrobium defluvii]|uniref:Uncharacterized protein n=1 Tax=Aquamicrobium defluvii TaxID=69279 RepID=A0A011TZ25_9HYPH|nr:hypothetical protein [Aquamicrobium defluvii]EXL09372.1 hypothetical protein BG36_22245 [Aquamicrobium defluvii]EZQ15535.1 hypothetical protein CF98_11130 [Halopseudomonas bauzanensis]TDR36210.1 hypothetical protein DES43_106109 [Aquamicrobium defluvii]